MLFLAKNSDLTWSNYSNVIAPDRIMVSSIVPIEVTQQGFPQLTLDNMANQHPSKSKD